VAELSRITGDLAAAASRMQIGWRACEQPPRPLKIAISVMGRPQSREGLLGGSFYGPAT